ncbi:hypothetical protein C7M84_000515 [Penaeus vannamei]|uniref:Calcium-activated chloride channel N-terminal domain-containing protein n=1 Tax=Penaeus vannamei TaxID=6689 RepID=A0A423TWA9_PENVA|nr:hypothetical protein C7M84_000515 [Penaeus vannamei]
MEDKRHPHTPPASRPQDTLPLTSPPPRSPGQATLKDHLLLLSLLQDAIKKASEVLFTATRSRAFFRDVRIVIPKSWSNTDTDEESELRIDNPNPVYENQPYTRQPGECGDPGEFIHMTPAYLKEQVYSYYYGPPAKVLVMEWARLRWGVYDEIGYSGDPKYPIFFSLPREVADGRTDVQNQVVYQVNVCTDTYLNGKERMWFDESMRCTYTHEGLPDGDCVFFPDANQTATSSLMSFPSLAIRWSNSATTTRTTASPRPSRNDRCDGQSVWEVMLQHSDFKGNA